MTNGVDARLAELGLDADDCDLPFYHREPKDSGHWLESMAQLSVESYTGTCHKQDERMRDRGERIERKKRGKKEVAANGRKMFMMKM